MCTGVTLYADTLASFAQVPAGQGASLVKLSHAYALALLEEAGQATEAATLGALLAIRDSGRAVLIGDHQQLRPFVRSDQARHRGHHISLLERLAGFVAGVPFRMLPAV